MKISYKGLQQFIDFDYSPEELDHVLTSTGLEVEGIETKSPIPGGLQGLVIGEVMQCEKHPNADKLRVTKVDVGQEELLDIVCGAPNVAVGQKVVVATVGAQLYPKNGEPFEIKKSKIRGEVSEGMICAEDEIGLGEGHDGILVLKTDLCNGTQASTYFGMEPDYIIEIGLTPNRADAASHYGVARDIKAINGNPIKLPNVESVNVGTAKSRIKLSVEDTAACPRFCGLEIQNVAVKPSPEWLKTFLTGIGINSINNIVDITNYVCHMLGQPMHIFDADKISGGEVVVRKPASGTTIKTLDGIERKLSGEELAICDASKPMAIAGVFGGENSGVSNATKNIFLEVAYFNPSEIRRAASNHSLKTDASFRYERGTDPNMPPYAIRYAAKLIEELAGGDRCDVIYDNYPNVISNFEVNLQLKNVQRLLGKTLAKEKVISILESLDIQISEDLGETLKLSVPPFRVDVTREADVIEEILRIIGFDQIEESEHLSASFLSSFVPIVSDDFRIKTSQTLAANGFNEIQTLSIVKPRNNELIGAKEEETVKLLNPLSEDLSVMRQGLLISGLDMLAYNINRRQRDLKVFEFGRSYSQLSAGDSIRYIDKQILGVWITGKTNKESWYTANSSVGYYDLAKHVRKLLTSFRMEVSGQKETGDPSFEYGMELSVNNRPVAVLGKVKNTLLKKCDIKQDVFYAEIDWAYVLKKYSTTHSFTEIPKFPEVRRDLSLVLNKSVTFDDVNLVASKTEKKLLKKVDVFDVYEGEKMEKGKKSYSVSFILSDTEKTLNDKQIDKTMDRLIYAFEKELNAVIRK